MHTAFRQTARPRILYPVSCILLAALPVLAQPWVSRYNGPDSDEDRCYGVAVDASGGVYVTGSSWNTGTAYDVATVKYGTTGETLWTRRFDGAAHGPDEARSIAARGGRVAVTGGSAGANLFTDVVTLLYDEDGDTLWTALYDGPGGGNDHGLAVTIDSAGNVYSAGYAYDDSTNWDFVTIKYNPSGVRQWVGRFATEFEDFASAIAVDGSGNCYVTGSTGNPYLLTWDYTTVKYNAAGVEQWAVQYNGPAGEDDEPHGIAVDRLGNVYVTGGSLDSTSGLDYATIKYNPSGETLWIRRYNGPGNGPDEAYALGLDAAGNVYVTGSSQGTTTDIDYATVKYDPDGNRLWVARYDGPASGFDEARAIVVDAAGYATVTGNSQGSGTSADYATVRYRPDGGQEWAYRYDGPASGYDEAVAIALDPTGGVCVTGSSAGSGTGTDYATIRYPTVGIAERPRPAAHGSRLIATVVRGTLLLPHSLLPAPCFLLTSAGRKVMELAPGQNDISRLAPGVYFARSGPSAVSRRPSAIRRIVIAD